MFGPEVERVFINWLIIAGITIAGVSMAVGFWLGWLM